MTRLEAIRRLPIQPVGSIVYLGTDPLTSDEGAELDVVRASLERQGLDLAARPTRGGGPKLVIVRRLAADVVRG